MWLYILNKSEIHKAIRERIPWAPETLFLRTKACNSYDYFWHYFSDILRSSKGKLGNKAITRILIPCSLIIFQRLNLMIYGSCTFAFKWILAILYVCRGVDRKMNQCQLWSKFTLILCQCDSAASVLLKCKMRHTYYFHHRDVWWLMS